jgi:peptidoglycan-associated lipoprotein
MKTIKTFAVLVALASLGACGSKKPKAVEPTEETVTEQKPADEKPTDKGETTPSDPGKDPASLGDVIYFEFDSNDLSESSRQTLTQNADWLKEDPARTLTIEGHTDVAGTEEYNLGLGERRARAAQDYLVRLGIDAARVRIITYGEEKPAADDDAKNRRSVFISNVKK